MQKAIYVTVCLTSIFLLHCSAQKVVTEIVTNAKYSPRLQSMLSGDSILFRFKESTFSSHGTFKTMWISATGIRRDLNLDINPDRSLVAFASEGKHEKYYFIESEKRKYFLSCLTLDVEGGTETWNVGKLEIPGMLLGSFFSDDLYLVCMNPNETILKVIQISDLKVKKERRIALPAPLLKKKKTTVALVDQNAPLTPAQAMAAVKIYRQDSLLLVLVDDPFDEFDKNQIHSKTTIYRINLESGRYSIRFVPEISKNLFYSIIFDGHLYRIVNAKDTEVQIYKISTGEIINIFKLSTFKEDPNAFAYWVNENDNNIRREKYKSVVPLLNYIIADTVSSKVGLRIGSRYGVNQSVPFLYTFGIAGALISLVSNIGLMSVPANPVIDKYFYLTGSPENGFLFTSDSGLLSQVVSEYDLEMAEENNKRYTYKSHLYGEDFAYGFYMEHNSEKIQILKFVAADSPEK